MYRFAFMPLDGGKDEGLLPPEEKFNKLESLPQAFASQNSAPSSEGAFCNSRST